MIDDYFSRRRFVRMKVNIAGGVHGLLSNLLYNMFLSEVESVHWKETIKYFGIVHRIHLHHHCSKLVVRFRITLWCMASRVLLHLVGCSITLWCMASRVLLHLVGFSITLWCMASCSVTSRWLQYNTVMYGITCSVTSRWLQYIRWYMASLWWHWTLQLIHL